MAAVAAVAAVAVVAVVAQVPVVVVVVQAADCLHIPQRLAQGPNSDRRREGNEIASSCTVSPVSALPRSSVRN